ncbi:MAG: sulfatase/phosphatase domain-containing protein, partial [Rhodospirillales bacterium]
FACSNEPHSPWNKGDASKYPPAKVKLPPYIVDTPRMREDFSDYLAEITYYDSQVGEIVGLLDRHGLADNTLVMVVSEQGNGFPFAKWTCYDHGLQSAMVVRWPGKVKAGAVTDAMVEYVDVTPTFIDAASGKAVNGLDGKSFLPVLRGETQTHKQHVFGIMTTRGIINGTDAFAIRSVRGMRYKLILNLNHESKFTNACTKSPAFKSMVAKAATGDATAKRLVHNYHHRPAVELFDLKN